MIFYHGTTLDAARAIQREGLIPHRETSFRLVDNRGIKLHDLPNEQKPYIYLTTDLDLARMYALFRTKYERAPYGTPIDGGKDDKPRKLSYRVEPNAKPAIVQLDVPQTITRKLVPDPLEDRSGYFCECVIPSSYVQEVRS